jgi:hypothetical protein
MLTHYHHAMFWMNIIFIYIYANMYLGCAAYKYTTYTRGTLSAVQQSY